MGKVYIYATSSSSSIPMTARTTVGEVYADVTIAGLAGRKRLRLLVDTGSTYTWIRGTLLRKLGIRSLDTYSFGTIEKRRDLRRRIGEGMMEYQGDGRTTVVVFGREGDDEVLGLHALEGLGLEVDPVNRRLRKRRRLLAL